MKKTCIALFLALVMACGILGACAEEFVVGGSSLEDCVSRMVGYTVETDAKGFQTIAITELTSEYFIANSENDIAFLPSSLNAGGIILAMMLVMPPSEVGIVTGFDVATDKVTYAITLDDPWDNQEKHVAHAIQANEDFLNVVYAMGDAKTVTLRFYQQGSGEAVSVEMTSEQLYLIQQFVYILRNFMTIDMTSANAKFLMSLLGGMFNYKVVKK